MARAKRWQPRNRPTGLRAKLYREAPFPRPCKHLPVREKDGVTRCLWCGQEITKGEA